MHIFVYEFLTAGADPALFSQASLVREGRDMLLASIDELSAWPHTQVTTLWHSWLGEFPFAGLARTHVNVLDVDSSKQEQRLFEQLLKEVSSVLVIAPEFHDQLLNRVRLVEEAGLRHLGCDAWAIQMCADKLAIYEFCKKNQIATIETFTDQNALPELASWIHKPRFGAGSVATSKLTFSQAQSAEMTSEFGPMLLQPCLEAVPLSMACVINADGVRFLPLVQQHLCEQTFQFISSSPVNNPGLTQAAEELILTIIAHLPGLSGYVGFDLLHRVDRQDVLLMEINPRLTSSYLTYRRMNLPVFTPDLCACPG